LLKDAGCCVRVFESKKRVGGLIESTVSEGFQMEWGPSSFLSTSEVLLRLVDRAGLTDSVVRASPSSRCRYLWRAGRLRSLPSHPLQFFLNDFLPIRTRARMLLEPLVPGREVPGETITEFFQRRFGRSAARWLADPMTAGATGGLPENLEVSTVFPKLVEWEREKGSVILGALSAGRGKGPVEKRPWALDGGMASLPIGLAAVLGDAVELETPVEELERVPSGWRLHLGDMSPSKTFDAGGVVLAVPGKPLSRLLRPIEKEAAELVGMTKYSSLALVQIGLDPRSLQFFPDGFGFLAPRGEGLSALGIIWSSSVFPHRAPEGKALLTAFLGGEREPHLLESSDDEIVAQGLEALRIAHGGDLLPELVRLGRAREAIALYHPGHGSRVKRIEGLLAGQRNLEVAGDHLEGVSAEASAASGERAARRLLSSIGVITHDNERV